MLLYAVTIFVSAFLLFQVQPVTAKIILPWFGGSAAVWTTCLLFFQVVLLLGYLYAHWSVRYLGPRVQALLHAALLGASILLLPVTPNPGWKPLGFEDPALRILGLLAATVGLPYFLLSTTGPLLQAWYARKFEGGMPYRLYALSNAGSMLALLSYPVAVEPFLPTRLQALGWSAGYVVFAFLCAATALRGSRRGFVVPATEKELAAVRPGWKLHLGWTALAACSSTLLLAVTNHLSQNVAAIPFLWILPLSLYLLSFIICFELRAWRWRNPLQHLPAVAIGAMAYALSSDFANASVKMLVPLFASALFICCLLCHGELTRLKPHPRYLTSFYLMISLGGALGGVFVALLAPHVFRAYYELQIAIASCALIALFVLYWDPLKRWWRPMLLAPAALTVVLFGFLAAQIRESTAEARIMLRNFYGGLQVSDTEDTGPYNAVRKLMHGTINHGEQFLSTARRDQPTTYYGPSSGVGLAVRAGEEESPLRVGVIGLGTGTLASYGRDGDYYRFYEINPLIIELARTQFTFLKDSKAKVEVALGDARLSLEREPQENFDVLAVDAFSGDSIPIHLLTKEAFALYFRHLKNSGVLAVHVSNKYLNLQPVVERVAEAVGKRAVVVDTEDEDENEIFGSTWVLVTSSEEFLEKPLVEDASSKLESKRDLRPWTDDYSNLFQILK